MFRRREIGSYREDSDKLDRDPRLHDSASMNKVTPIETVIWMLGADDVSPWLVELGRRDQCTETESSGDDELNPGR